MTASGCGGRLARTLVRAIRMYQQMISPMRLPSCRFTPTCSQYAVDALSEYGVLRGGWLSLVRLIKCGPWHSGGWDPIPQRHPQAGDDSQPEVSSAHV
jgi:putative membrane protein insertion efficiency factor